MKLHHIIALTLCLQAPLSHTNSSVALDQDPCSLGTYAGCTLLMGAGALCATGAYIAHKASRNNAKQNRFAAHSLQKDDPASQAELTTLKYVLTASATALSTCSLYCLNSCLNKTI
jgi:hypothetical protein